MSALLKSACCVIALLAAVSAQAQSFGNLTVRPGETAKARIMGLHGYSLVRLCNDFTSAATITAIIHPRDPRTLTPGECTEDTGDEIEVTNRGTGPAMVVWQPPPGFFLNGKME